MGRNRKVIPARAFTKRQRVKIIEECLTTNNSKQSIWEKYAGPSEEKGTIIKWMRQLGYLDKKTPINTNFSSNNKNRLMAKKKQVLSEQEIEKLQLKKRIAELEKQLKDAELKAIAFSTMVDIAEREFKIPIRKKLNTKP